MRHPFVRYIYIGIIICVPLLSGLIFLHAYGHFFSSLSDFFFKKDKIHIALVAPLESKTGQQIRNAVELYLNGIHHRVKGRPVELHYYNDIQSAENAEETALEIINESESLVVLGHHSNIESVSAGKIYKKNEMPAITASASAEAVTSNNRWYFRIIPNARVEAMLIAHYLAKNFSNSAITLLYEDEAYSQTLMQHFIATINRRGLVINNQLNISDLDGEEAANSMISRVPPESIVFIAASASQGAKALTLLKNSEKKITIFGPEEFATENFITLLEKVADPKKGIGFYLNNLYCATPYMSAIANDEGHLFEKKFIRAYGEPPVWEAACYYDALDMAIEAIEKTAIERMTHIKENRRRVRDALDGFFSSREALEGLVEDLYFNSDRDVIRPYAMARYFESRLISAPLQYQTILDEKTDTGDLFEGIMKGSAINMDGRVMRNISIIYTWIDDISVEEIDFKNKTCSLQFHLSLRHITGLEFDAGKFYFADAIEDISPGKPIMEEVGPEMTSHTYQIRGRFRMPSDFSRFPFDRRIVAIRLMNKETITNTVRYLPDELKIARPDNRLVKEKSLPGSADGWRITAQSCYEDFATKHSHLGLYRFAESNFKINHSRFNVEIDLTRKYYSIAGAFLPIIIILLGLYLLILKYPDETPPSSATVPILLFIVNGLYHGFLLYRFPWNALMTLEYGILTLYLVLLFFEGIVIGGGKSAWTVKVMGALKVFYPICTVAGCVVFYLIYGGR